MADVNVKKQSSEKEKDEKTLQTRSERGLSRRGWGPFSFSPMRSDFFSPDPLSWMPRFHEEMDRTFARFFGKESEAESGTWYPAIEVAESNDRLQVHAELPGLQPEDVKLEVTDDALIIQGERKYEHEDKKGGVYRSERGYGQFYREIPLPEGANAEQAKAQFRDGILEVVLPVAEQKNNRRMIPIESGSSEAATSGAQK
jgi:HSP20 family protein